MKALLRMSQPLSLKAIDNFRTAMIGAAILVAAAFSSAQAATITVNTASDGLVLVLPGQPQPCSLRDAITAANTNQAVWGWAKGDPSPAVDTILFNIGAGTPSIKLRSMLRAITEPVIIRGDSGGATRVELNGVEASWRAALLGQRAHGLFLFTGDSTIRNLVINRFNGNGIVLTFSLNPPFVRTRVFGSITNSPSQAVVIQFFHSQSCDPSNHGEGQTYLGSITLPGNGAFSFIAPVRGGFVTATATNRFGLPKTSEFSACLPV